MTFKIRSRSPKPNQLFIMSQYYIHANFIKIHLWVHELSCKQESVRLTLTPMPKGSAPKTMSPSPSVGDINIARPEDQTCDLLNSSRMRIRPSYQAPRVSKCTCIIIKHLKVIFKQALGQNLEFGFAAIA